MGEWTPAMAASEEEWIAAAVFEAIGTTDDGRQTAADGAMPVYDPWAVARGWRNVNT
jgi:hypothetical protein